MDQALVHVPQSRKLWELWADWIERRFTEGQLSTNGVQAQYMAAFARVTQHRAAYATREDGDGAATLVAVVAKLQVRYVDWAWSLPQSQKLGDFNAISSGHAMDEDSDDDEAPTVESGEAPKDEAGGNVDALRQAYRNVQRHAFPTPPFFRRCIALEPDTPRRIDLHEMACRVDESDVKPWLAYLRFLVDAKQMTQAVNVFRRASNAVPENQLSELESSYQKLLHKDN
ncbi:hypothetical protein LPJ61_006883 [Coemansia biformis]|uniref:Suppressor of forked domain-containing protein n=1 Tax=Coemansia biformis TaxID=1286918 RepID=A0A9W8CN15_9FUNG|nr:hypothetical protein LPJ61_006883 [Coemansia biformis]